MTMRSVLRWALVVSVASSVVVVGACATPAIDDSLSTDDVMLPDRDPSSSDDDGGNQNINLADPPADGGSPTSATTTLTVALTGAGSVTSTPAGLTCTATTCTGTFPTGTTVALTPTATAGSVFDTWSGACVGSAACGAKLDANVTVNAAFAALDGTWTGTYTNARMANGCNFTNAGNLNVTATFTAPALAHTATVDGLELRDQGCNLQGHTTGSAPSSTITVAGTTLTGTWNFNVQGANGSLAFPFTAKISGKTMSGTWTCTGCTGSFKVTKP
jgi:hypothetical protein